MESAIWVGMAINLVESPMVDWREAYELNVGNVWSDTERTAAHVAIRNARLSAYLSRRMAGASHEVAVRHQNAVAAKVRKALGFTYFKDDVSF